MSKQRNQPPKKNKKKHMRSPTKEKHTTLLTHDNQIGVISRITKTPGETHKGTTSPTLGQWLACPLYLHLLMEKILNQQANKEIMPEEQGLNKKGPNLTLFQ